MDKIKLYGFNNLTKSLSFNIYDVCYAASSEEKQAYVAYIDEEYNSERLEVIIMNVAEMIGATVLNVSRQDYEPEGASATFLIADGQTRGDTVLGHLDKSHITVHTYPEYHPDRTICTFRVDIDVSTCGRISPLSTLDYLIDSFDSDIITMDYRIRGFTRDLQGNKIFRDEGLRSIQDYIRIETLAYYEAMDINMYANNTYHTRMMIRDVELDSYIFNQEAEDLSPEVAMAIKKGLRREMIEIYSAKNVFSKGVDYEA